MMLLVSKNHPYRYFYPDDCEDSFGDHLCFVVSDVDPADFRCPRSVRMMMMMMMITIRVATTHRSLLWGDLDTSN